jgi:hypothetical protein
MQIGTDRSSRAGTTGPTDLPPFPDRLPAVELRAVMPGGFRAGALPAGIKPSGRPDLGVIATTADSAAVAATFTRNQVVAAPIKISQAHLSATEVGGGGRIGWTPLRVRPTRLRASKATPTRPKCAGRSRLFSGLKPNARWPFRRA